jgi:SAM-dependent methyltransferase
MAEPTFPAASQHSGADGEERTREVLQVGTRGSLVVLLPPLIVMAVAAPWILRLWLGTAEAAATAVLRITAAAVLAHMLGAVALHVLWGRGRARAVVSTVATMTAGIVALAWILIPRLGPSGAAWAAVLPMLVGSMVLLHLASVACGVSVGSVVGGGVRGLLLPTVVATAAALSLERLLGGTGWIGLIVTSAVTGLLFLAVLYAVGGAERRLVKEWSAEMQAVLRRVKLLRVLRDFYLNSSLLDNRWTTREYWDGLFSEERDPWDYERLRAHGRERFDGALAVLEIAAGPAGSLGSVLEIGCAEGHFTEVLESRCDRLTAVDISAVALERSRTRRDWPSTVRFEQWDALCDPLPRDDYDVVIVMGVLDYVMRRQELATHRERLVNLVRPSGYLFVESTRTGGDLEDTWWRRVLPRGRWLNRFVGQHAALEEVAESLTSICARTLYRRRS